MEQEKNNKSIIALLLVVIVILLALVILFATGTISLKSTTTNSDKSVNEIDNSHEDTINNEAIYSAIISEYKDAIKESNKGNTNYKYVNATAINHYFNQIGTEFEFDFKYVFYDINNDGTDELLINNGIIDIFSYDGSDVIRLFKDDASCLAESRCQINLYDDGTIYFSGSGGAAYHYISFYSINKNASGLNSINSYLLKYGNDGSVTIYDEETYDFSNDTGTKLDYSSDKDLINANIHNAKQIDLNSLNWTIIN